MASIWDSGDSPAFAGNIKIFSETVAATGSAFIAFSTLTFVVNDPFDKEILVCGVWQRPAIDYIDINANTVQFTTTPTIGETVTIKKIGVA